MKRQGLGWEKIFTNHASAKNSQKLIMKTNNPTLKNEQTHFSKEDIQMVNDPMTRFSTPSFLRKY